MAILPEVMVLLSVGGIIMGMTRGGGDGVAKSVIRSAALNPVFLGIVGGAVFAATGLSLPGPAERFLSFLGNSSGPTALFALGGMLAVQRIDRSVASIAVFVTAAKLAIYPALVWLVLSQVLRLDNFLVQAAVLMASLPSAGSVFVLAQRFDGDADGVSAGTVLSTMVSVATVPLATWLVFHA
jgi:predicted permease